MKKFLIVISALALCFCTACSFFGEKKKSFTFPVTEFEERNVKITAGDYELEGKLSCSFEQLFTLTLFSPEAVSGMKITHNSSGTTTDFLDLAYNDDFLSSIGLSEVFDAIKVMSNTENLTEDELGYYGFTTSGKSFTVLTDEEGNILKITLEGISIEFI